MIWGCMLWERVGDACDIDGNMDGDLQISPEFYNKTPQTIIFQQDNTPKHTCKKA